MTRLRKSLLENNYKTYSQNTHRAYLDIETDRTEKITVVGCFRPGIGCRQWTASDLSKDSINRFLSGVAVLMTYNGKRFDLPIIKDQLKLDLASLYDHRDLMYDCWKHSLYGGLKKVEQRLGIHRDTEGVDGLMAIRLWNDYTQTGNQDALDLLLRYNKEDVENLECLAIRLKVIN